MLHSCSPPKRDAKFGFDTPKRSQMTKRISWIRNEVSSRYMCVSFYMSHACQKKMMGSSPQFYYGSRIYHWLPMVANRTRNFPFSGVELNLFLPECMRRGPPKWRKGPILLFPFLIGRNAHQSPSPISPCSEITRLRLNPAPPLYCIREKICIRFSKQSCTLLSR